MTSEYIGNKTPIQMPTTLQSKAQNNERARRWIRTPLNAASLIVLLGVFSVYGAWHNDHDWHTPLLAVVPEDGAMLTFDAWIELHGRTYATVEERELRRQVYASNIRRWEALNQVAGGARFGPESEPYADVTATEFANTVEAKCADGRRYDAVSAAAAAVSVDATAASLIRYSVDWRNHRGTSYVTPVKNQGPHGTCWSFGVAENLEGLTVRQGFALVNISEQEFISCCNGCGGRKADVSFAWLLNHTGGRPALESSFPYVGNKTSPCLTEDKIDRAPVTLHSWGRVVDDGTGQNIRQALRRRGPMGMGIDASCFHGYQGGIVRNCTSHGVNHAVLMVASGTEYCWHDGTIERVPFFTIKNSWSHHWGEAGYGRFEIGHEWWGPLNMIYTE